jgi:protein involved in polysaccharide export with SLBB domain
MLMNPKNKSRGGAMPGLVLSFAGLLSCFVGVQAASVALPSDITVEQAKAMAAEQQMGSGMTSRSDLAPLAKGTVTVDSLGSLDPQEGSTKGLRKSQKKSAPLDSTAQSRRVDDETEESLRWGRTLFREADPSLFASHVGAVGQTYTLGPGDQIILTIWGEKEARYDLSLDRDGQVRIELIGAISLNGQSLKSAEDLLRKRLTKVYGGLASGATQMDLTLGKLKQVRVYVVGDVVRPGSYLLSGNTSVFSALYHAQGPSELGTERAILLLRDGKESPVDLYDYLIQGRKPRQDVLQDGDVLRVPRHGKLVRVAGDVGRPGLYELLDKEGAKELLTYSGGVNATTASTGILATRLMPNGRKEAVMLPSPSDILAGAKAELQDGDSVHVFQGVDSTSASVTALGLVRYPGAYPWREGMTVSELVKFAGGALPAAYSPRVLVTRTRVDGSMEQFRADLLDSSAQVPLKGLDLVEVFDARDLVVRKTVLISGAVVNPGEFDWKDGMTVKDLVLQAGGFRADALLGRVRIESPLAQSRGSKEEWLDLDSSLSLSAADRVLTPESHLSIPQDPNYSRLEMIEVIGWVAHPGSYSLLRSDERITDILTRAGGIRPEGYPGGARLVRGEGQVGRIQVKFLEALQRPGSKHDLVLRSGDTLIVPKRPATLTVKGRVNNPGSVIWTEGKSWKWYVEQAGGTSDSANEDGIYVEFADGSVETRGGGITNKPDPGAIITVPFRKPPEPTTFTEKVGALNTVLATVIAGLTIFVLLR